VSSPETQAWLEREHPEVLVARDTSHPFVHGIGQEGDKCWGTDGLSGCICSTCWEPKSRKVHRATAH
jgi:hypothetical protein